MLERMTEMGMWEWRLHSFDGLRLATGHEMRTSGAIDALEPGTTAIAIESAAANSFEHLSVLVAASVELAEGVIRY